MTGWREGRHRRGSAAARILPAVLRAPRFGARAVLVLFALAVSPACSTDCQRLCTAWYDYQRDVCGQVNTDDDRVTCISDYRRSNSTPDELAACASRIGDVNALRTTADPSCCSWDADTCPPGGDDDDSAVAR